MADPIDTHDGRTRRCPMLGHEVAFSYCRAPGRDLPCGRVFDCWWETFDVRGFLAQHLSPDQIREVLEPRKDKRVSLLELIERARGRQSQ